MAHAEGVVAGVLGEEGGEIGVGCGGFCVEEEDEGGGGEEGAEDEEESGDAEGGVAANPRLRSETWGTQG